MKKRWPWLIALALLIGGACVARFGLKLWEPKLPARAADGAAWSADWEPIGPVLGVEAPGNGFALRDNSAILTADDTFYAAWTSGDPAPYVNADGDEVDLYEAQIYLLLQGCRDAENARTALDEWRAREEETYDVREVREETHNGWVYTVLVYEVASETNPYARGATAFATCANYALTAELSCVADYGGDPAALLGEFLDGCHYSADALDIARREPEK